MVVNVEFKSKCEVGDKVQLRNLAGPIGNVIKIRFCRSSREFECLVEVDDGTRQWVPESIITRFLNTREAFNNLMEAVNNED